MPRIYSSVSDPIDFCLKCFPKSEKKAFELYGHEGDGPDDRGNCFSYNESHPDYDDTDYRCDKCKKYLTNKDN